MKKIIFSSIAILLTVTLFAQPEHNHDGPPKPPPVAERWKRDSIKLQLYVTLSSSQINNVKATFVSFYNDMEAMMEKGKTAPPPKGQMESVHYKRNDALKSIFNSGQWDRFETFEREFMPPPPQHPPMNGQKQMPPINL